MWALQKTENYPHQYLSHGHVRPDITPELVAAPDGKEAFLSENLELVLVQVFRLPVYFGVPIQCNKKQLFKHNSVPVNDHLALW